MLTKCRDGILIYFIILSRLCTYIIIKGILTFIIKNRVQIKAYFAGTTYLRGQCSRTMAPAAPPTRAPRTHYCENNAATSTSHDCFRVFLVRHVSNQETYLPTKSRVLAITYLDLEGPSFEAI